MFAWEGVAAVRLLPWGQVLEAPFGFEFLRADLDEFIKCLHKATAAVVLCDEMDPGLYQKIRTAISMYPDKPFVCVTPFRPESARLALRLGFHDVVWGFEGEGALADSLARLSTPDPRALLDRMAAQLAPLPPIVNGRRKVHRFGHRRLHTRRR